MSDVEREVAPDGKKEAADENGRQKRKLRTAGPPSISSFCAMTVGALQWSVTVHTHTSAVIAYRRELFLRVRVSVEWVRAMGGKST